ncbi:hypothetical protein V1514DRAFT_329998 [Lipomyces japonicus]|uniref:uncharacterized protein n=1 Tax=Lipomyces japonicus TaxID=56871 RepID=UPI0034CE1156
MKMAVNESSVFIVTGASRGLGFNIAEKLLSAPISANVVAVARSQIGLAKLSKKFPGQVESVVGDISDYKTGSKAVKTAIETFGKINGIVFNAAVIHPISTIAETDINEFKKLFDINFFSILATLKDAIPYLRQSKGRVLLVSSEASYESHFYGWEAYGSSKACVNHLAATLAVEEPDITAVSVDPGVMDTSMQEEIRTQHGGSMRSDHYEYLAKIKEEGTIEPTNAPATVISNLVVHAPKELSGKYHAFNSPELAQYLN